MFCSTNTPTLFHLLLTISITNHNVKCIHNSNYLHGFIKMSLSYTSGHFPFCSSLLKSSQPYFGSFCWTWTCWSLPKQLVSNSPKFCLAEHLTLLCLFPHLHTTALIYCYSICTVTRHTLLTVFLKDRGYPDN